jgi:hypothetical protein
MNKQTLYSKRSNLVLGFHGCDQSVVDKVLIGSETLHESTNDYDWLGHGVYFWENNKDRAFEFACTNSKRRNSTIKKPAVIGAVIDLGYCMDLIDSEFLNELKEAYNTLKSTFELVGETLPENKGDSPDKLLRKLDCAVIETAHAINKDTIQFDSVRGVFWEGDPIYPGATFSKKNHIQICIRNPNCIKGFFLPKEINKSYINP